MKTRTKTIELFLALGLAASVTACAGTPDAEDTTTDTPEATEQITPEEDVEPAEGGEGGEGGEG